MVAPKPYGLHVKNGEPTQRDLDFIASVVHRFSSYKANAQLHALKKVYTLPDGGVAIISDAADIFKVIVDKHEFQQPHLESNGFAKDYIPMFYSGVITRARLNGDELVAVKLTEQCRRRLKNATGNEVPKDVVLDRLTVDQNQEFPEFISSGSILSSIRITQYAGQNHAWYSGAMAQVMQLVGGYGKQNINALPDTPIERAQILLPEKVRESIWEKYQNVRLPGYEGVPPSSGQFQYDYKWRKTHAVSFDSVGKPWLVEVSDAVWVMPLPIVPMTADSKFREYVEEELQDQELIKILETFGAMPSGEGFPSDRQDFNSWVRAGVIIKVCEVADFRSQIPMFDECGWSFNMRGISAYNTGYRYDETTGLIYCSTYKLSLSLGASAHYYGTEARDIRNSNLSSEDQDRLAAYMAQLFAQLSVMADGARKNAIAYKLRHIKPGEILERAGSANVEVEIDYWDNYQAKPIAIHTGNVSKVYGGYLYHPNQKQAQPQIKFPNYQMGYCESFDFTPLEKGWMVACDTIMYAYYDRDSLKVVKYFYEGQSYAKEIDTDYEQVMTVGKWYWNETEGLTSLVGNFYTTDIDERDEVSPQLTETTVEGRDAGFDSKPFFSFDNFFWRPGSLWRNRYFTHLTKTTVTYGSSLGVAVLIPGFNRFTVLHAKEQGYQRKKYSESLALKHVRDPYSYRYWTNHPIWAWIGGLEKATGNPYPTKGNPVWVEIENYEPSELNNFADQGPWIPALPADYGWLIHPDANEWLHSGGGGPPKVNTYSDSREEPASSGGNLKWVVWDNVRQLKNVRPDPMYFVMSPDEYGFTIYRSSSRVSFGDAEYVNISESNEMGMRAALGTCSLVDSKSDYHFIGVINE
ncbi:hypothetical protein [Acinetobacter cumulans]|uniref:hypothetical protein n=1 Tax=Acinetobacter cumulans TaxID=2136182 RepID=UPI001444633E|nr:hypothetical protein [Acinetobacter cumulans]